MSDLVGNPEDRFSHNEAHVMAQLLQKDDKSNTRISSSRTRTEEPHIGKYRLIKTIGKGNFAKVKLAKHVPTGREVCVTLSQFPCSHQIGSD